MDGKITVILDSNSNDAPENKVVKFWALTSGVLHPRVSAVTEGLLHVSRVITDI